jgi:hypothetical protein
LLGVKPIRFNDGEDIARFQRDDQFVVAFVLGDFDVAQGAIDHRGGAGEAVLHGEFAFEAAGVDADAHRNALVLRLAHNLAKAVHAANVARVQANLVDRMIEGGQGHLVIEMDIDDQRQLDAPLDLAQHRSILRLRHRDAHQLAAGLFEAMDLGDGRFDVVSIWGRHRLNDDRIVAADNEIADLDFARFMACE